MRGRRLTLSLEAKQKEEEAAPFGCFERPHFDKQQTEEVWNQALQLLSASPSPCQGYEAYVRTVRSHGDSRAPVLSRAMFQRLTIIHLHVTTAILEEYLVLSRSTTIEVQQRLRERRLRIMWPLYADYLNRYVLQSDGFWPEKKQSPNGAVGTQSSLTFSLVAFCQLTKADMTDDAPSLLLRYPHRFVDNLGEDGVASGDMDPLGQKECYHAILDSDHNQLVLGCVWTVDGDVTEDSKSVFSIKPFNKKELRPRRARCIGHKGKSTRKHTTGPVSGVKKQVCMSVNSVTGQANCKHRKDQHRWHDELGYSLYHYEMNTFKLADSTLLPELKLVSWYDTETKMPLDVGSRSGIRATLKSRALGFVKRRLSGERVVAHAMGKCDGICDHGELDQTGRKLFSCDGQAAYVKDLMDKTTAKADEFLSDFGCLNINIEESFHAQAALFCQKGNNLDWPLVFTFQNMAALNWIVVHLAVWEQIVEYQPRRYFDEELASAFAEFGLTYTPPPRDYINKILKEKVAAWWARRTPEAQEKAKHARIRRAQKRTKGRKSSLYKAHEIADEGTSSEEEVGGLGTCGGGGGASGGAADGRMVDM